MLSSLVKGTVFARMHGFFSFRPSLALGVFQHSSMMAKAQSYLIFTFLITLAVAGVSGCKQEEVKCDQQNFSPDRIDFTNWKIGDVDGVTDVRSLVDFFGKPDTILVRKSNTLDSLSADYYFYENQGISYYVFPGHSIIANIDFDKVPTVSIESEILISRTLLLNDMQELYPSSYECRFIHRDETDTIDYVSLELVEVSSGGLVLLKFRDELLFELDHTLPN